MKLADNMEKDEFKTISGNTEGKYSELRSKFLAYAFAITNEEEAHDCINQIKHRHHDARHVAYAYCLGPEKEPQRYNDDGEPSGTAGKPIMGVLRSNDISNVLVVVARYFGGVKLGTSRLAEAYKAAAIDAVSKATITDCYVEDNVTLRFTYEKMNAVMNLLRNAGARILENTYRDGACEIMAAVRRSRATALQDSVSALSVR